MSRPRNPSNRSPDAMTRRRWYSSPRWRELRRDFLAAHPRCCHCGAPATIADHRDGHQDPDWRARFWQWSALQPLCAQCHAPKSAREGAHKVRRSWFGHGGKSDPIEAGTAGRGAGAELKATGRRRAGSHPRTASPQSEKSQPDARASAAARLIERLRDRA